MTAIIGFNYLNGVLMMSDTEESLGGDAKSECDKLCQFSFLQGMGVGTVITGGAGDSHLIDCANEEMLQFFQSGGVPDDEFPPKAEQILNSLNSFAAKFFEEVVCPTRGFTYEPVLEMLISISFKEGAFLFCWKRNRMHWVRPHHHACIGSGVVQVHPMLRDIQFAGPKECMFFHGIRMMYHAKRAVVGVGGKTEAIALQHDGATLFFGTEAAQKTEELVIKLEQFINQVIYLDVSAVAIDVKNLDKNVKDSLAKMPEILDSYRNSYRKILNPQLEFLGGMKIKDQ